MRYLEAKIKLTPFSEEAADIVTAEIEELGFESFMCEDPYLSAYISHSLLDEQAPEATLNSALEAILSKIEGGFSTSHSLAFIEEENWNEVWESNFDPIIIDGRCTIKASFHEGLKDSLYNIIINPKMAFGTGHHQTTSLMVEALLNEGEGIEGLKVLDMGCGTGILAILAAMLGAAEGVHAVDIDDIAVASAKENAELNKMKLDTECGDALKIRKQAYNLILANINRNILLADMKTYAAGMIPGGRIFLSGFYVEDIPILLAEARKHGFDYVSQVQKDDWAILTLKMDAVF